jgi:uncharacterized protein YjbI with pentapeptide repeats
MIEEHMDTNHQDKNGNKPIATEDKLWIPPLTPKEQKEVKQIQKYLQKKSFAERMGFTGKKPWDLIQLLLIPLVIAGIGYWFTGQQNQTSLQLGQQQHETDIQIANEQQQEAALKAYLDDMSTLLLSNSISPQLHQANKLDEIRKVAQAKTLIALENSDKKRKRSIVLFLYGADLITWHNLTSARIPNADAFPLVALDNANLSEADLSGVFMTNADLYNTDLNNANLSNSVLSYDNLSQSIMHKVNLSGAVLHGANLYGADLSGANLSGALLNCDNLSVGDGAFDKKMLLMCPKLNDADQRKGVDLSGVNLSGTHLQGVDLRYVNLTQANLSGALIKCKSLQNKPHCTNLSGVNLSGANLSGADLSGANLKGATVTQEQLAKAKSLQGTIMPDGSIQP